MKKSTINLFADGILYAPANNEQECRALQNNLTAIFNWTNRWQLKLNIAKCEALAITNKRKPISFTYFINGQSLSWNNPVKYLGLLVDRKLKHCRHVVKKATRSLLNCLRFLIYRCSCTAKCAACKAIVHPSLEYTAFVCNPHTTKDINLLELLQNKAVRLICSSCWNPAINSWTISYIHQLRSSLSIQLIY